jgi:calcineurin-like phosphoesterase family protein
MKTFFTSDLHFHHKNITAFTDRKLFTSPEDHDEWLIEIWNKQVSKQDKVWHLGDFSFSKTEEIKKLLRKLNGQKFFIKGNHDRRENLISLKLAYAIQNWDDYKEIKIGETPVVLFHFPIASWHRQHHGALHLHGHCHGSYTGQGKILDVGIDNAYNLFGEHRFFTEEDVIEQTQQRSIHINDHHRER